MSLPSDFNFTVDCPKCGEPNAPGAASCEACGASLDGARPPEEPRSALPDWLQDGSLFALADEPDDAPDSDAAQPVEKASGAVLPDWLAGASWAEEEPKPDVTAGGLEARSLLDDEPDEEPAAPPEAADAAGTGPLEDLATWFATFETDEAPDLPGEGPDGVEEATPAPGGEDLLGLDEDLFAGPGAPGDDAPAPDVLAADPLEMPDWLRQADQPAPAPGAGQWNDDLLGRIQGLRYKSITGQQPEGEPSNAETVGALKNVSGVIQPEIIFEGSTLSVGRAAKAADDRDVMITSEQAAQIDIIKRLLAEESSPPPAQKAGLPLLRWAVTLAIIAAVALPLLVPGLGQGAFVAPRDGLGVGAAFDAVEALAGQPATVFVAFEYEPDTAAEMQPLADALLSHLAQGDATVYAASTHLTGPALAQAALEGVDGLGWTNLGYQPGGANAVNRLTLGATTGIASPLALDAAGEPTGAGVSSLNTDTFDLIVVLSARPDDVRLWVEQAGVPTGVPILAAVSARAVPAVQPYARSGQLAALIGGLDDAAAYHARLGGVPPALQVARTAQSVGGVVAALLILAGGVAAGFMALRPQQEQA